MNQQLKKQYDSLHSKIEAIYLGATGKMVAEDENYDLTLTDADKVLSALYTMNEASMGEIFANDFQVSFGLIAEDLNDIDTVTDWLFEKGLRA